MSKMTFEEYLADFPGTDLFLTPAERAREYQNFLDYTSGSDGTRTPASEKTLAARAVAKEAGGAALKGTRKQKAWAEQIRAEKLRTMTDEQKAAVTKKTGLFTHSKFWIENRECDGKALGADALRMQQILSILETETDMSIRQQVADEYNNTTSKWGF